MPPCCSVTVCQAGRVRMGWEENMDGRNGGGGVGGGEELRISILTTLNNEKWCLY